MVLSVIACTPATGPEDSLPPVGKGIVNIRLGIDPAPEARTLVPGSLDGSAFDIYELIFTAVGSGTTQRFSGGVTSLTVSLDAGTYDLALAAKNGDKTVAAGEYKNIIVTNGVSANVMVPLVFKPGAGEGTLSFTITRPFDLSDAQFVLTPLHGNGTTYGTDWLYILYNGEKKETQSSKETIASGYYQATVTLSTSERKAVKSDIVHIGAGQTTTLNLTFTEVDFSTIVENIWLLGVNGQWDAYGEDNKLTQADNGTFVWEGSMGQDSFRFSLEDSGRWNDDKDRPKRFQPAVDNADITLGTAAGMTHVANNTGTATRWNLGGAGYYRFVVDPYAKTVVVTKPSVVTGVEITGGDAAINKGGSHNFAAVVNGYNSPSQDVTWSITSPHVDGTAFSGNTLTIDAGETEAALTIRAASTEDSSKSAKITVTVRSASSPVVTGIVVTAEKGAAELYRAGTVQFDKTVAATNGATEDVTWSVSGKDKDGAALASVRSSINASGLLTVASDETAVDLVVRAASKQSGYTNVYGEAAVFVRKLGSVYLIGDEFGKWTDTGTVELMYAGRGVYTKTVLMSKGKSFKFRDDSGNAHHFEPGNNNQEPNGTVDARQHHPTQNTAWTTTQGGSYGISLDTAAQKVAFTRTSITGITVEVTYGYPMTAVTKINNIPQPNASVTWTVEKSGGGAGPYGKTTINQEGWLTAANNEPAGKEMIVRAASNYDDAVSGTCKFTIDKYPNVWLVGGMQGNWSLPGILMQRSQDGQTFTWQGTITQGQYFRFNRDDMDVSTANWSRNWLGILWNFGNPRQINTGSSGDDCKVAPWDTQNIEGNKANWQFSGATGTYKIIMDVSTMTIRIEAL
jgi:hypothetical protein